MTNIKNNTATILVFDSGVGGLSILNHIHQSLPQHNYVYACDNQGFPYGTKHEEHLVSRIVDVLKRLNHKIKPDIVVVACNTASTLALEQIRKQLAIRVVGVVPAIKPAAQISQTGTLGLLATPATVARPYTQQLVAAFASHCHLIAIGSSDLVQIAENKVQGIAPNIAALQTIIAPLFANPSTDTIVLACTHFPLLLDELKKAAPRAVNWIDSGAAIARRVSALLNNEAINIGTDKSIDKNIAKNSASHKQQSTLENTLESKSNKLFFNCFITEESSQFNSALVRQGATNVEVLPCP